MSTLRSMAAQQFYRAVTHYVPRAATPYASHVPVLIALAKLVPFRRVLELGSGEHSTRLFLNRDLFPHVSAVRSIEDDVAWYEQVRSSLGGDPRLDYRLVAPPVAASASEFEAETFDLIFIDDSRGPAQRSSTIEALGRFARPEAIVVVHDFENRLLRAGAARARTWQCKYRMIGLNPNVGVLWNGSSVSPAALRAMDRVNAAHRGQYDVADARAWAQVHAGLHANGTERSGVG